MSGNKINLFSASDILKNAQERVYAFEEMQTKKVDIIAEQHREIEESE